MSPKPDILDLEALLKPISEESPSGISLRPLGVYDDVKAFRTTESAESMVGTLRVGEYKSAQWGKAITLCVKEISTRSKDLQLAVWLAESLVRVYNFPGLTKGLEVILGINERFFPTYYPPIEDGGLDMRAGRLAELEKLLIQSISNCPLTAKVEGETHATWEWKRLMVMQTNAGRAKPEEKEALNSEANELKDVLEAAVAKTSWEFYDDIDVSLTASYEVLGKLRTTVDELFAADPTYRDMEDSVTGFSDLRKEIEEVRMRVQRFRDAKPTPPGRERKVEGEEGESAGSAEAGQEGDAAAAGGGPMRMVGGGFSVAGAIAGRADALKHLTTIAEYFQKTEPHSPVAYLVQRAVRWGEMPLENWLDEVVADPTTLNAIRETLGLPKKEPVY